MPPAGRGATIDVTVETGAKKTFASALDWPGWSRSGKTEERALGTLIEYADRYARVAARAGETFDPADYDVVERTAGGSGTDFGVPRSEERRVGKEWRPRWARHHRKKKRR